MQAPASSNKRKRSDGGEEATRNAQLTVEQLALYLLLLQQFHNPAAVSHALNEMEEVCKHLSTLMDHFESSNAHLRAQIQYYRNGHPNEPRRERRRRRRQPGPRYISEDDGEDSSGDGEEKSSPHRRVEET